jgi:hypothetical protein
LNSCSIRPLQKWHWHEAPELAMFSAQNASQILQRS